MITKEQYDTLSKYDTEFDKWNRLRTLRSFARTEVAEIVEASGERLQSAHCVGCVRAWWQRVADKYAAAKAEYSRPQYKRRKKNEAAEA